MHKIFLLIILGAMLGSFGLFQFVSADEDYNYGDYKSQTLMTKAWEALGKNDLSAVLAYTNKCLEFYDAEAKKMQKALKDYPKGDKAEIVAQWWAINDVATALYIQGEAYRNAGMNVLAKSAYRRVIDEFSFGQCWDDQGWFWRPAEAAREKLSSMK